LQKNKDLSLISNVTVVKYSPKEVLKQFTNQYLKKFDILCIQREIFNKFVAQTKNSLKKVNIPFLPIEKTETLE
jgi:hypothetical protein